MSKTILAPKSRKLRIAKKLDRVSKDLGIINKFIEEEDNKKVKTVGVQTDPKSNTEDVLMHSNPRNETHSIAIQILSDHVRHAQTSGRTKKETVVRMKFVIDVVKKLKKTPDTPN